MVFKSIALAASILALSFNVSAALVTHGYLSTNNDGSSNIITDSLNNVEYLRFDVLADLTYAQTLAVLDTQDGGGWSIAGSADALSLATAVLGVEATCTFSGADVNFPSCGVINGWTDGDLGANYDMFSDYVLILDEAGNVDLLRMYIEGILNISDFGTIASSDIFSADGSEKANTISWLLVRDTAVVPAPAAVWLFGSGLIGLIGLARRKKA